MTSWFSLHPQWLISERTALARSYPDFRVDQRLLSMGILVYYGDIIVRPAGGAKRFPVQLHFPAATPFEFPVVTPLKKLPEFDETGSTDTDTAEPQFFDRRHQMPGGGLCLFQRETRGPTGGEAVSAVDVLRRAEAWFIGHLTGNWPPDTYESELEPHFYKSGDILLSRRFYDSDIGEGGSFHMVRDMTRVFIGGSTDDPPFIMTVIIGNSDGIETVFDAREDLEQIFPWLGNDAWSPDSLAEIEKEQQAGDYSRLFTEHGYWWRIPSEPRPFKDGKGLLRELESVAPDGDAWTLISTAMRGDLAARSTHYVGLRFPGRFGRDEWLIVSLSTPERKSAAGGVLIVGEAEKRAAFEAAKVGCVLVHGARPDDLGLRNKSVVAEGIAKKAVVLLGLGALGSKVAELLAQAGVENFRLCDPDTLTTSNVARHLGGLTDFGEKKTKIVATRLRNINPRVKVQLLSNSATQFLSTLETLVDSADLVVSTMADENAESVVNQIAVLKGIPALYGRAMRRGSMGRVFLVRPGHDACKGCLGVYAAGYEAGGQGSSGWIAVKEKEEDILLHECGRPVIPASAIDLSFVAALVARKALEVLEGQPLETNHWVWSRDAVPELSTNFTKPFTVHEARWPPSSDCRACCEPDVNKVVLRDGVKEAIHAEVLSSIDAETGGILIGYLDGQTAVVTKASGPGPKAKRSPYTFDRDIEFVQAELDAESATMGDKGLYIGEWHSHLEKSPRPSGQDITSMCGIADAPNYATRCPVMIIAGLDVEQKLVTGLKAWSFPVSGRMYPITIDDSVA